MILILIRLCQFHASCCAFRAEIAVTDGRLMAISQEINTTAGEERFLQRTLSIMEDELRDLNYTVANMQLYHLPVGFAGADLNHYRLHSDPGHFRISLNKKQYKSLKL